MGYGTLCTTTQGAILAAKTLQSKLLKFSRFAIGSGETTDAELSTLKALTNLVQEEHSFNITRINEGEINTQVNIKGTFKNTDVAQGFFLRELGLFAIDPDTQAEVLFAYINYGDKAEYIHNSIAERKEYFYDLVVTVDNANNVKIVINQSSAFITEKELQEALKTKANIPRSKTITLSKDNWVQNETTQKYECTVADTTITVNDYVFIEILDDEKVEAMAGVEWETYSGGIKFKSDEQIISNVQLQLVIMRTAPEEASV